MRNRPINPYDVVRWSWYKTWILAFLHPTVETGQAILSDSNITIRQAVLWNGLSAVIYYLLVTTTLSNITMKNLQSISIGDVALFIYYGLISIVTNILGLLLLSGFVHLIVSLFKRKGSLADLYLLFTTINSPIVVLLGLVNFIGRTISIQVISISMLIAIYAMVRLFPFPARVAYRLNWLIAFLFTVILPLAIIFSCCLSFVLIFPLE
jgi:hypothetical protein